MAVSLVDTNRKDHQTQMGQKNSSEQQRQAEQKQQADVWHERKLRTIARNKAFALAKEQVRENEQAQVIEQAREREQARAMEQARALAQIEADADAQALAKRQALLQAQSQGKIEAQARHFDQMEGLATASSSHETADYPSHEKADYHAGPPGGAPIRLEETGLVECRHSHGHCMMAHKCCICRDQRQQREGYPGYVDGVGMRDEMARHDLYCPSCKSYLQGLKGVGSSASSDKSLCTDDCWRSHAMCQLGRKCCICEDKRPHQLNYVGYVDGIGMSQTLKRHQYYCPSCKANSQ
jgi:hypothetical protein